MVRFEREEKKKERRKKKKNKNEEEIEIIEKMKRGFGEKSIRWCLKKF